MIGDVRASVLMKAEEIGALREQTLGEGRETLFAAAAAVRDALDAGGKLLALGNGGSATDAMDAVADFRAAPQGWPARRAQDLTEDPAILTAIANDIGPAAIFSRQIIAYGRAGDVLLALSTSGNSENVIAALAEAGGRGLRRSRWWATTAGRWRRKRWRITWWSRAPSTSRASRRPRPAPTTSCASSSSSRRRAA